jgi:hypothetical protein
VISLTMFSDGLVNSALPTILVSCKCDNPENTRQINVESMELACHSCIEAVKTAANVPESARLCLSSMLRAIMMNRNGKSIFIYTSSSFSCKFFTPFVWVSVGVFPS